MRSGDGDGSPAAVGRRHADFELGGYDDELSLADVVAKGRQAVAVAWSQRALLGRLTAAGALVGVVIAFGSGVEYTASTKLLPYGHDAAGISGLASLAGVRMPSAAGEPTITPELYPEVAKTLDFRIEVAETPLAFSSLPSKITALEYLREVRTPTLVEFLRRYTVGLPGLVVSTVRGPGTVAVRAPLDSGAPPMYDRSYLRAVRQLGNRMSVTIDKKTFVITVKGTMPDPIASAELVRATSQRLMERVIEYEVRKASEQLRYVEVQHAQAKERADRAQRNLAAYTDRNRVQMTAMAKVESARLEREYELAFEMYQQLSRELESARLKKSQDTPVFTVLEQVSVPTERSAPRRLLILVGATIAGLLAGLAVLGWRHLLTKLPPTP